MAEPFLRSQFDYDVPLLRVLAAMPAGMGQRKDVLEEFRRMFNERIPPEHLQSTSGDPNQPKWSTMVTWSNIALKQAGLADSPAPGKWRITQDGRDWLAQNPEATRIKRAKRASPSIHRSQRQTSSAKQAIAVPLGITFDMLERTRLVMPAEQFRKIWGAIYDQLLAEERAKAITEVTDKDLLLAVRHPIRRIHDFLQGRGNDRPKSEEICDWIHFCYSLGLYREAAALWQYVHQDEINPWQFERTKKMAAVCRSKAGF